MSEFLEEIHPLPNDTKVSKRNHVRAVNRHRVHEQLDCLFIQVELNA